MKEEFTKADLKDGMIVEQKNGERFVIYNGKVLSLYGWNTLKQFRDDLTNELGNLYNIEKVYKLNTKEIHCLNDIFCDEKLELVWERNEAKEMTVEEMRRKLEELTGEKIETEPSREEMIGSIDLYCHSECCSSCAIYSECSGCSTDIVNMPNEKLKECYEKVIKDGNKTKKM